MSCVSCVVCISLTHREECTIRVVAKMDDGSPCRKGGAKVLAYFVSDAGGRIDNPDLQVSTRDNSDGSYLVTFEVNKARTPLSAHIPTFNIP